MPSARAAARAAIRAAPSALARPWTAARPSSRCWTAAATRPAWPSSTRPDGVRTTPPSTAGPAAAASTPLATGAPTGAGGRPAASPATAASTPCASARATAGPTAPSAMPSTTNASGCVDELVGEHDLSAATAVSGGPRRAPCATAATPAGATAPRPAWSAQAPGAAPASPAPLPVALERHPRLGTVLLAGAAWSVACAGLPPPDRTAPRLSCHRSLVAVLHYSGCAPVVLRYLTVLRQS